MAMNALEVTRGGLGGGCGIVDGDDRRGKEAETWYLMGGRWNGGGGERGEQREDVEWR